MIQRYEPYEKKYECISGPPIWRTEFRPAENGPVVLWEDYEDVLAALRFCNDELHDDRGYTPAQAEELSVDWWIWLARMELQRPENGQEVV